MYAQACIDTQKCITQSTNGNLFNVKLNKTTAKKMLKNKYMKHIRFLSNFSKHPEINRCHSKYNFF